MSTYHHYEDVTIYGSDSNEIKEQKYLQAIEKHPEAKGYFLIQLCHLYCWTMHEYEKALACSRRVLNECTDAESLADAYYFIAVYYEDKGDYSRAISNMQKRFDLDNTDWETLCNIGRYYCDLEQFDKAEEVFSRLLTMKDEDGASLEDQYYNQMVELYLEQNNFEKAIESKQQLLKYIKKDEDPSLSEANLHFEVAELCKEGGKAEQAREHYRRSIEIYEGILEKTGRGIEEIRKETFSTYKNHDEDRILLLENLANVNRCVGNNVQANEYYERTIRAIEDYLMNPNPMYHNKRSFESRLPDILHRAGNDKQAIALYEKLIESPTRQQTLPYYYRNIAYIYHEAKNFNKESEWWLKVLDLEPESEEALRSLSALYYDQKKFDIARPYLERYIEIYPEKDARAYSALAFCFDQKEEPETVLSYLRKAIKVNNDRDQELSCGLYLAMGKVYWHQQKDAENAIGCFRKMMERHPSPSQQSDAGSTILVLSFSPEGNNLATQYWNDFPNKKDSVSQGVTLTASQIEALPYHHSKIPKDTRDKLNFLKEIEKDFQNDLKNNPAYKEYFAKYNPFTVEKFIYPYAEYKQSLISSGEGYMPEKEERAEGYLLLEANNIFELILQKKLFNLQLLWRAEKITIPQIEICEDFNEWSNTPYGTYIDCPFLEEVTPREIELMKQFLMDDNFNERTQWWLHGWQDYNAFMEENPDGDREYMPDWYEFYDGRMGTGALLLLSDERGKKEAYYTNIYWDWKNKQPKDPPPPPSNDPPYLPELFPSEAEYTKFMNAFENNYLNLLHKHHTEEIKSPDEYYPEDELWDAITYLKQEKTPPYIEGGVVWYEALIKCYRKVRNKAIADKLDEVYADYLMKRQLNALNIDSSESNPPNLLNVTRNRSAFAEYILKGRELLGEPRDFNF